MTDEQRLDDIRTILQQRVELSLDAKKFLLAQLDTARQQLADHADGAQEPTVNQPMVGKKPTDVTGNLDSPRYPMGAQEPKP